MSEQPLGNPILGRVWARCEPLVAPGPGPTSLPFISADTRTTMVTELWLQLLVLTLVLLERLPLPLLLLLLLLLLF